MLHSRKLNSREKELEKDNSATIHNRNIQLLSTELFKVKNGLSPPFMNEIFVENAQHYYDFRKNAEFKRNNVKTVYNRTENLTFLGPRIWKIVPDYIKKSSSFEDFKAKIKLWNSENCPCRLNKRFLPQVGFL